ncbi:MAG: TerB family tellurite resistance protein [Sedimentisphaerales bacterium]
MGERLNLILKSSLAVNLLEMVKGFHVQLLQKIGYNRNSTEIVAQPDPNTLNSRVQLATQKSDNSIFDVFNVEICGTISAPSDMHYAAVQISITDITDGLLAARPVHSKVKQWQMHDSGVFIYNAELGKLPNEDIVLPNWIPVAQLHLDWLLLPRRGPRDLQFITSILSRDSLDELACAMCTFTYQNREFGYIDLQENIQRAKMLAVTLAFAVSAADNKLYGCEIELVKKWARKNIDAFRASGKIRRKLEKALDKTVDFFRRGYEIDTCKICEELVEIVPLAQRYDVLDLCMRVAKANGLASEQEVAMLKNLANWLEVDTDRFRAMMEKILPAGMHEVEDVEVVLGIDADMGAEQTRKQLNQEYRKWSSRVTNFDPEIRTQADYMIKFIAEARTTYVK